MNAEKQSGEVELQLRADLVELQRIDATLAYLATEHRFDSDRENAIKLCSHEIFTNIVFYGLEENGAADSTIGYTISIVDGHVKVKFSDHGVAYDPLAEPDPSLPDSIDKITPGGLGLLLVKAYAKDVTYRRENDRNLLELQF